MIEKCVIDENVLKNIVRFAAQFEGIEWGGALLGWQESDTVYVILCFFPPQMLQYGSYCEFDGRDLIRLKNALSDTLQKYPRFRARKIVGWIHTHPHLSVFLSSQDLSTFNTIFSLEPNAVAVVIDPFCKEKYSSVFTKENLAGFPLTAKKLILDTYYDEDKAVQFLENSLVSNYPNSQVYLFSPNTKMLFDDVKVFLDFDLLYGKDAHRDENKPWEDVKKWSTNRKKCKNCGGIIDSNARICEFCRTLNL